jgi:hypothetical protein
VVPQKKRTGFWSQVHEMSSDVQCVASVLRDAPEEVTLLLADRKQGVSLLRSYLYGLGWGAKRVTECFSEIREALR